MNNIEYIPKLSNDFIAIDYLNKNKKISRSASDFLAKVIRQTKIKGCFDLPLAIIAQWLGIKRNTAQKIKSFLLKAGLIKVNQINDEFGVRIKDEITFLNPFQAAKTQGNLGGGICEKNHTLLKEVILITSENYHTKIKEVEPLKISNDEIFSNSKKEITETLSVIWPKLNKKWILEAILRIRAMRAKANIQNCLGWIHKTANSCELLNDSTYIDKAKKEAQIKEKLACEAQKLGNGSKVIAGFNEYGDLLQRANGKTKVKDSKFDQFGIISPESKSFVIEFDILDLNNYLNYWNDNFDSKRKNEILFVSLRNEFGAKVAFEKIAQMQKN